MVGVSGVSDLWIAVLTEFLAKGHLQNLSPTKEGIRACLSFRIPAVVDVNHSDSATCDIASDFTLFVRICRLCSRFEILSRRLGVYI